MRMENSIKRFKVNHENGEQREGKQFCSMRNCINTGNREQKEKKILTQSELRIEHNDIEQKECQASE